MAKSQHSIEQKLSALRMMEEETYTWKEIIGTHGVSRHILQVWKVKFDTGWDRRLEAIEDMEALHQGTEDFDRP